MKDRAIYNTMSEAEQLAVQAMVRRDRAMARQYHELVIALQELMACKKKVRQLMQAIGVSTISSGSRPRTPSRTLARWLDLL